MMANFKTKEVGSKSLKKYYQMFHYLLHLVCLNVFITYKQGGSISRLDFLLILAESQSSLGGVVQPATRGHPSKLPTPWTLLPRHSAIDIKEEAYQDVVFWANGKRKELSYWHPD